MPVSGRKPTTAILKSNPAGVEQPILVHDEMSEAQTARIVTAKITWRIRKPQKYSFVLYALGPVDAAASASWLSGFSGSVGRAVVLTRIPSVLGSEW